MISVRYPLLGGLVGALACAPAAPPSVPPSPVAGQADSTALAASTGYLPPLEPVHGPIRLTVAYPPPGAAVEAGDSSFMFGTTGTGDARLTINGQPVRVAPNGAWLAWLPFPHDSVAQFVLEARSPTDSGRLVDSVRRAPKFQPPDSGLWVDTTSLVPRGAVWIGRDESLPLAVRATPGAELRLRLGDSIIVPLDARPSFAEVPWGIRAFDRDAGHLARPVEADRYAGQVRGIAIGPDPGPILPGWGDSSGPLPVPPAPPVSGAATLVCDSLARTPRGARCEIPALPSARDTALPVLEVIRGGDTLRVTWPLRVGLMDSLAPLVRLDDDSAGTGASDSLTIGRAEPGATYNWFFPTGTVAPVSGRLNGDLRLQLARDAVAWVPVGDAHPLARSLPATPATVGSVTLTPDSGFASLRIPVSRRVPFQVVEGDHGLVLTLYGARGDVNWIQYGADDSLVRRIQWTQPSADRVALQVETTAPLWGWRTRWDRDDLILDVRRPPRIDPGKPFAGRLIVVDPGHPPLGAVGPTGLREPEANLAVALRLRDLLQQAGAHVVMTRTANVDVGLYDRTHLADTLGAELLVSIHNNALPDGVNPFINNGTSVYYNHVPSLPLARLVQRELVKRLGLRDLGVGRGDLALVRPTWMPAVLAEGLFLMVPEQEGALRSPEGQQLYAEGVFEGLRRFLRERAASQ